jgi:peroxiredoxin Q/BCP
MKKLFLLIGVIGLLAFSAFAQNPTATPAPTPPPLKWKVGDVAPDFTLTDTSGKKVTLSDFRGKNNVVLAFFVLAFTGG